jgi:hypothetical protein
LILIFLFGKINEKAKLDVKVNKLSKEEDDKKEVEAKEEHKKKEDVDTKARRYSASYAIKLLNS